MAPTPAGRRFRHGLASELLCRRLCSYRLFLLAVLVVAGLAQLAFASAGSRKVVTSLPGYNGSLPFYLETG
jgi:hypothetical protein